MDQIRVCQRRGDGGEIKPGNSISITKQGDSELPSDWSKLVFIRARSWLNPAVNVTVSRIEKLSRLRPTLALVLGSGFKHVLGDMEVDARVAYAKLPGFPQPTVAGHDGELVIGKLSGTPVIVLSGRAHYYEGYPMERVVCAVQTLAACGVRDLLLTNAAGGINRKLRTGDFMLLSDHINFMGANPLRPVGGDASSLGAVVPAAGQNRPRFVDLTRAYDSKLSAMLVSAARTAKVKLRRGVYLAVSGPSYETPAEIRAFARLGADAVGMSTVPEVIVARQCGLRVAALSCITNLAAGLGRAPLSHEDVLKAGERVRQVGASLLKEFAKIYGKSRNTSPQRSPPSRVAAGKGKG